MGSKLRFYTAVVIALLFFACNKTFPIEVNTCCGIDTQDGAPKLLFAWFHAPYQSLRLISTLHSCIKFQDEKLHTVTLFATFDKGGRRRPDGEADFSDLNKPSGTSPPLTQNALLRLLRAGKKTVLSDGLAVVESQCWWRWTPAEQRDFLERQIRDRGHYPRDASLTPASPSQPLDPPFLFHLRYPFLLHRLTSRLAYHPSTGRFALAEKPWLEENELYRWSIPFFIRFFLKAARPLYAPIFCFKWLGLRAMILWRSFSLFVLPSVPYVALFTFRAIYMLAACALVTVALDELMHPFLEWTYNILYKGHRPLPDLSYYNLAEAWSRKGTEGAGGYTWRDRLWTF